MNRLVIVRPIESYDVAHHEQSILTILSPMTASEFEIVLIQTVKSYSEQYKSFDKAINEKSDAWSLIEMESDTPEAEAFSIEYAKQETFKNENRIFEHNGFKFDLQDLSRSFDMNGEPQIKVIELQEWFESRLELSLNKFDELFQEYLS